MSVLWASIPYFIVAQSLMDESWGKIIVQLGIAGAWLWWLTGHLKDQTKRDDTRHDDNVRLQRAHAVALERLTLVMYDVLDELSECYPHAKERVRTVIRQQATEALEELRRDAKINEQKTGS